MNQEQQPLEQLQAIFTNHQQSTQAYQHNKQQAVFKLPKHSFIGNILPFLDDKDVLFLSNTCKALHGMIYSPFAFQFLLSSQRPQKRTMNTQSQYIKLDERKELPDVDDEDPCIVQLQNVMYINDYMAQRAAIFEQVAEICAKDKEMLTKELKIARERTNINFERIIALDRQVNVREVGNVDHGDTIGELKMNYQVLLQEKDENIKRLKDGNVNMIEQKERLRKEMIEIKKNIEKMAIENQINKEALVKVNKFFSFAPSSKPASATTTTEIK